MARFVETWVPGCWGMHVKSTKRAGKISRQIKRSKENSNRKTIRCCSAKHKYTGWNWIDFAMVFGHGKSGDQNNEMISWWQQISEAYSCVTREIWRERALHWNHSTASLSSRHSRVSQKGELLLILIRYSSCIA